MAARRYYPVGIQTFSELIEGGYVYVDKTDLMWHMQDHRKYLFLARPRRFGKSLLSSTFNAFFSGRKELFEGLKVMELEREWKAYPVIHLDLSGAKHLPPELVRLELLRLLAPYEEKYGRSDLENTPGMKLAGVVTRAKEQTGRQAVVIIDEYDAPLLDALHNEKTLAEIREVMQEFYQRLKQLDPEETCRSSIEGGLLGVHPLSHLLYAQCLCTHAGEMPRWTHRHGGLDA